MREKKERVASAIKDAFARHIYDQDAALKMADAAIAAMEADDEPELSLLDQCADAARVKPYVGDEVLVPFKWDLNKDYWRNVVRAVVATLREGAEDVDRPIENGYYISSESVRQVVDAVLPNFESEEG